MNADKLLVFNRRLSAFIGGWVISSVFQHPVSLEWLRGNPAAGKPVRIPSPRAEFVPCDGYRDAVADGPDSATLEVQIQIHAAQRNEASVGQGSRWRAVCRCSTCSRSVRAPRRGFCPSSTGMQHPQRWDDGHPSAADPPIPRLIRLGLHSSVVLV